MCLHAAMLVAEMKVSLRSVLPQSLSLHCPLSCCKDGESGNDSNEGDESDEGDESHEGSHEGDESHEDHDSTTTSTRM